MSIVFQLHGDLDAVTRFNASRSTSALSGEAYKTAIQSPATSTTTTTSASPSSAHKPSTHNHLQPSPSCPNDLIQHGNRPVPSSLLRPRYNCPHRGPSSRRSECSHSPRSAPTPSRTRHCCLSSAGRGFVSPSVSGVVRAEHGRRWWRTRLSRRRRGSRWIGGPGRTVRERRGTCSAGPRTRGRPPSFLI